MLKYHLIENLKSDCIDYLYKIDFERKSYSSNKSALSSSIRQSSKSVDKSINLSANRKTTADIETRRKIINQSSVDTRDRLNIINQSTNRTFRDLLFNESFRSNARTFFTFDFERNYERNAQSIQNIRTNVFSLIESESKSMNEARFQTKMTVRSFISANLINNQHNFASTIDARARIDNNQKLDIEIEQNNNEVISMRIDFNNHEMNDQRYDRQETHHVKASDEDADYSENQSES